MIETFSESYRNPEEGVFLQAMRKSTQGRVPAKMEA